MYLLKSGVGVQNSHGVFWGKGEFVTRPNLHIGISVDVGRPPLSLLSRLTIFYLRVKLCRSGSALERVPVPHLHVGWRMALLCLISALPRWLVCALALR